MCLLILNRSVEWMFCVRQCFYGPGIEGVTRPDCDTCLDRYFVKLPNNEITLCILLMYSLLLSTEYWLEVVSSAVLEPLAVIQRVVIKGILRKGRRHPSLDLFEEFPVLRPRRLYIKNVLIFAKLNRITLFNYITHNYNTRNISIVGFHFPHPIKMLGNTKSYYVAPLSCKTFACSWGEGMLRVSVLLCVTGGWVNSCYVWGRRQLGHWYNLTIIGTCSCGYFDGNKVCTDCAVTIILR